MAVPEGPTDKRYTGNGVTKIFTIPFLLLAATDLDVYIDGIEISSGFAITNVGNPTSTITFTVAPVDQADIYLQLNVPFERLNDYQENGDFLSSTVNRDFDRIWQALKQLFRWSTRSLRLGNFDVDGAGWYRAKGNGIRDLKDPVEAQDASTKVWTQRYVGDVIGGMTGNPNLASNVFYRGPDGLSYTVQDMSNSTDIAKGAHLHGYKRTRLSSAIDTAGEALDAQPYNIFEFSSYVTDKPTASDPSTWDWSPAIAAALNRFLSEGGGSLVFPAGHSFPCRTKVGKFRNLSNVTIIGYGAEIVNYSGPLPLIVIGDDSNDGIRFTQFGVTARNTRILGLSFRSGNPFGSGAQGAERWADASPLQFNTSQNCLVRDCSFTDLDFSAVDFGAACRDCLIDRCRFYSSRTEAGHANYGVRIFCYSTSTGINLSPTDPTTGLLLPGYSLPPTTGNFGHENISVTNSYFENISHGVMVFAGRRGLVHGNTFVNMSTRSISLSTYTADYLCSGNTHSLNTAEQLSSGVSVFYNFGQESLRNTVRGDKFTVHGPQGNATGFSPIKALLSARGILIEGCEFQMPSFNGGNGQFCIVVAANSEANIRNNFFNCPLLPQAIAFQPLGDIPNPGFQQGNQEVVGNVFNAVGAGCIQIANTTSAPGVFAIKDNVMFSGSTRFVVNTANAANRVPRLMLSGNKFFGAAPRYVDNTTEFKAKLLAIDTLEFVTRLIAQGAVNPSATPVTFDFSEYLVPLMYSNGTKQYQFSAYGGRENAQLSSDFFFRITGETATSVSGDIVRNAGTAQHNGYVSLRVIFTPFNT